MFGKSFIGYLVVLSSLLGATTAQAYDETYRPQYHFTPEKKWMNDPNGMVFHKGVEEFSYLHGEVRMHGILPSSQNWKTYLIK